MNKLILGDNLEILRNIAAESVDLVYIDPPFFSNRTYEVIWGDSGEVRSFEDRFSGGMDHYIGWLKERIIEMHRILKPTGSIFVHCDWHADAYIRVQILDRIFGGSNFRNKITWQRSDTHNDAKHQAPNVCDDIFVYSKSDNYTYNVQYGPHAEKTLREWYQYIDFEDGTSRKMTKEELETQKIVSTVKGRRFNADNMASPNPRPNLMYEYKGYSYPAKGWRYSLETMTKLDAQGKLLFPKEKSGRIMLKRYLDEQKGSVISDLWNDIDQIRGNSKEKIGYPTQKPMKLLERIIQMASNEGDTVLDCFVGGGTTVAVADKLNRQWIGIDQSVQAVKVTEYRLNAQQDLFSKPFTVTLHKYDYDTLRYKDAFEFETWAVQQFGGTANAKQRGDLGIDGIKKAPAGGLGAAPIQVKRSDNIGRNVVDNFHSAVMRYDKAIYDKNKAEKLPVGYIIAFSFGKGAIQEVARLSNNEGVLIKLITVESFVPIAKKPNLTVEIKDLGVAKNLHEIEFIATVKREAGATSHFFAWDFSYKNPKFIPEIYFDKDGRQTYKFKAGTHEIAVKVVDDEGLESIEIVKLKVNGTIERK